MKSADATIARVSRKTLACLALCALGAACSRKPAEDRATAAQASPAAAPVEVDTKTPLKDPLPMVAARVNGRNIPTSQVVVVAESALRDGAVKDKILAYRQTLNQLVVRELLLEEAVRRGLAADNAAVERAYNEARVAYKDDAEWKDALKKQGFTPEGFREELRSRQTVSLLLSQEAQKVPEPSEAELRELYTKNAKELAVERRKAAHVLIRVPDGATPQQRLARRARAEEVRRRVQAGGDFAALAKRYSEDTTTRDRGGVLEPFGRGEIMKPVEQAAFALRPGEVSDVVETQHGYHVIKLLEKIPGEPPPFEQVKDVLKQQLAQARRQEHLQALVNRLRARARIETFL